MDFPTLLIRDATKKNGFYKRQFEHGHFNVKDVHEWGYIIASEDIGKILERFHFRWFNIKGMYAAFLISATRISNLLK